MNETRQDSESLLRIVCEKDFFFFNWWITKSMSRYASSTKFFHFLSHTHTHTHTLSLFLFLSLSHTLVLSFSRTLTIFLSKSFSEPKKCHMKCFLILKLFTKKFASKNLCFPFESFWINSLSIYFPFVFWGVRLIQMFKYLSLLEMNIWT